MSEQAQHISSSRHERYYLDDEISTFRVEDKLFKVHRYFLTQGSDVFRAMFTSPPPPDGKDGVSDDRPIILPEVKVQEFERLLDFFYFGAFRSQGDLLFDPGLKGKAHQGTSRDDTFLDQWIDLLSIATRFDFQQVRSHAIRAIGTRKPSLEPIRQIVLSVKFDIPQWLKPAFESLCQRESPLQVDEAEKIGLEYSVLLAQAREQFWRYRTGVSNIVQNVFFPS